MVVKKRIITHRSSQKGGSPIVIMMRAIMEGNTDLVNKLLDEGADPNTKTPLIMLPH
jgi:hypothetical protein